MYAAGVGICKPMVVLSIQIKVMQVSSERIAAVTSFFKRVEAPNIFSYLDLTFSLQNNIYKTFEELF